MKKYKGAHGSAKANLGNTTFPLSVLANGDENTLIKFALINKADKSEYYSIVTSIAAIKTGPR